MLQPKRGYILRIHNGNHQKRSNWTCRDLVIYHGDFGNDNEKGHSQMIVEFMICFIFIFLSQTVSFSIIFAFAQ